MIATGVDILMYHSISDGHGPISIRPDVFRNQMDALGELGCRTVGLAGVSDWLRGKTEWDSRCIVLTFDDGFEDFASEAFPILDARGWGATVFLPAGKMGGRADWESGEAGRRRLMSWDVVRQLAGQGIEFGGHGVTHRDLVQLPPDEARDEIASSGRMIEDHAGCPVTSFAAPFGRTTPSIRADIARYHRVAAGTSLGHARRDCDPYDLPRIEMWYFRNLDRWRALLRGKAETYLRMRRTLRTVRNLAKRLPNSLRRRAAPSSP